MSVDRDYLCADCQKIHEQNCLIQNLAMLLRRTLHKHANGKLTYEDVMAAIDFLKRHDLLGSPLREIAPSGEDTGMTQDEQDWIG